MMASHGVTAPSPASTARPCSPATSRGPPRRSRSGDAVEPRTGTAHQRDAAAHDRRAHRGDPLARRGPSAGACGRGSTRRLRDGFREEFVAGHAEQRGEAFLNIRRWRDAPRFVLAVRLLADTDQARRLLLAERAGSPDVFQRRRGLTHRREYYASAYSRSSVKLRLDDISANARRNRTLRERWKPVCTLA